MAMTTSSILDEYTRRTVRSKQLADEASGLFPGGVTHDSRYFKPYPMYVERASGSRKWDVDGNEYVDYAGGHGAMLLGHAHPEVTRAVQQQLERGTHYGACHELEMRWAKRVQQLIPSAERVRFTSSGTEATLLALRLARAFTGRQKIVRFTTHFHGWHDHASFGVASHHDGTPTPGVLPELAENVILCPPGDLQRLEELFQTREDIAAMILEPTGATFGQIPLASTTLKQVRELTEKHGVLLVFDEVVTGFRCSPNGAQGLYGITPELTTLAKILAGGLPGGAIVGRRDILELFDLDACQAAGREKIPHQGTFNASPASAVAGITALEIVAETDACQRAIDYAARLRDALNETITREGLDWRVYGSFSAFQIFTNPDQEDIRVADLDNGLVDYRKIKAASSLPIATKLRMGMLVQGVDIFSWPGGVVSMIHDDQDLAQTTGAFAETIKMLKAEDEI